MFPILLFILQCIFIVLFYVHDKYGFRERDVADEIEISDTFR
jgi:hypothetical protein